MVVMGLSPFVQLGICLVGLLSIIGYAVAAFLIGVRPTLIEMFLVGYFLGVFSVGCIVSLKAVGEDDEEQERIS